MDANGNAATSALIRRIVGACRRKTIHVLVFCAVVTFGAWSVLRFIPPEYQATAIVFLGGSEANLIAADSAWSAVNAPARDRTEEARTVAAVLTSLPVLRRVVYDLELYATPEKFEPRSAIVMERLEESLPAPLVNFFENVANTVGGGDDATEIDRRELARAATLTGASANTLMDVSPLLQEIAEGAPALPPDPALASNSAAGEDVVRHAVGVLIENLEVEVDMRSKLGFITYTGSDPELVAAIVNDVPSAYAEESAYRMAEGTRNAIEWLEARVEAVRQEVLASERKLGLYRAETGMTDGLNGSARTRGVDRLLELVETAQRELIDLEDRLQRARDQIDSERADPDLFSSPLIGNLVALRADAEARRREYLTRVSERHAVIKALDEKIAGLTKDIAEEKRNIVASFEQDVQRGLRNVERAKERLRKTQENLANSAGEAAHVTVSLDDLKREAEANEALHAGLLARLKQVRQLAELQTAAVQMVQPALPPTNPMGVSPKVLVAATGVGSLFFGFAFVAGLALIDRRILDADQIQRFDFDAMVSAPFVRGIDRPKNGGGMARNAKEARSKILYGEAVRRTLAATLYDPDVEDEFARLALVTSGSKGEGKTTVAYTLARNAAAAKIPTVLVEADLRRPGRLARSLGHWNEGLTGYLEHDIPLANIEHVEPDSGLTVIPTTKTVQHSTELLASTRMHELLRDLSERFSFVVIDSAPVCMTPDPEVLAPYVHHVVFVMRQKHSTFARTARAIELLGRASEAPLIAFVNMTDDRFADTYYGPGDHTYFATPLKQNRWRTAAARLRRPRPEAVSHNPAPRNGVRLVQNQKGH